MENINLLKRKILKALKKTDYDADIFLLSHAEIKKIKSRFIKKETEPNVLAFREPIGFPHPELQRKAISRKQPIRTIRYSLITNHYLGEIYLNNDILKKSPERAAPLLLHGILHLLGYDHLKNAEFKRMDRREQGILKKL